MTSDQPNVASIFNAARKLTVADERAAFLAKSCGADIALLKRVEKLLAALTEESQYLEQPAPGLQATILTGPDGSDRAAEVGGDAEAGCGQSVSVGW